MKTSPSEYTVLLSFTDFLKLFPLYRGKGFHNDSEGKVGCIKGDIKIYRISEDEELSSMFQNTPPNGSMDIIVRIYVVKVWPQVTSLLLSFSVFTTHSTHCTAQYQPCGAFTVLRGACQPCGAFTVLRGACQLCRVFITLSIYI